MMFKQRSKIELGKICNYILDIDQIALNINGVYCFFYKPNLRNSQ